MAYRGFIEPNRELETVDDPAAKLGIPIHSGYQAMADGQFLGENRIFDRIFARAKAVPLAYEDQCSSKYYFDLVRTLRDFNGHFDRVVEVGVFMGGSTAILAGCMAGFDFELDLVDVNVGYLQFAYERARRMYPDSAPKIRLFHGDLPSYVRAVMMKETGHTYVVHHDGSHYFEQVVKDLGALSYVREKLLAIIAQDTHLRGALKEMNFVDLAIAAVFGTDFNAAPIGTTYGEGDPCTVPNDYEGNYFVPGVPEGLVLPMAANRFRYPHPKLTIDDFLPPEK